MFAEGHAGSLCRAQEKTQTNRSRSLESLSREQEAQGITPLLSLGAQLPE